MNLVKLIVFAALFAGRSVLAVTLYPNEEGDWMMKATFGGFIAEPKSGFGAIKVYNAQSKVSTNELLKAFAVACSDQYHFEFELMDTKPVDGIRIELIEGNGENTLCVYPDACHAVIDVAALSKDNPKLVLLAARVRKELLRAFIYLGGAVSFAEPEGTLVDAMTSLERLDAATEKWPSELTMRMANYLERSGVKPWDRIAYKDACEMGIAPLPKNPAQQKIWNMVHSIPKNPMRIEFDPKKGR